MPTSLSLPCDISAAACLQFSIPVLRIKPLFIEAKAQPHPCAVQHYPAISRADRQFLTDFFRLEAEHLAHHENPRRVFRQACQADLEHLPELPAGEAALRVTPARWARVVLPVAFLVEQVVIGILGN